MWTKKVLAFLITVDYGLDLKGIYKYNACYYDTERSNLAGVFKRSGAPLNFP
jgi:hypothetical protein